MNSNFPRILTLLRKERGKSQKAVASDLGVSQALLSHYEKGVRECGLDFVVRVADYYEVSCDYLLGRSPHRTGATLTVDNLPEPDAEGETAEAEHLLTLSKKLVANALNIIFSILKKFDNRDLAQEAVGYLGASIYRTFRLLYSANHKNPQGLFALSEKRSEGLAFAAQAVSAANIRALIAGEDVGEMKAIGKNEAPSFSPETLSAEYPLYAESLFSLIQITESRMGVKKAGQK